jgi:cardiolipin synthase (CMP-forming)
VTAVSSRILTIPNVLSVVRLLLIPVFLLLIAADELGWAVLTLAVSSLTDFADGYIARRFGQVSRLGQLLDPAADRLYILTTLLGITWAGVVPWWFVLIVVAREVLLLVLGVVLANHGYGPPPVHHLGKVATFALLFGFPVVLLGAAFPGIAAVALPIGWALLAWGAFLYWWAGAVYAIQVARLTRRRGVAGQAASDTVGR